MLGHGATGQFAIGQVGAGAAEVITLDKWFVALSEPVRYRPGLMSAQQQFMAPSPQPFVSFSWFEELSKPPVLTKPGLQASKQQFMAFNPQPFVSFSWFESLSEPVRFRPGLKPAHQRFFTGDTSVLPLQRGPIPWYMALSEPVRFRPGLAAARQQFLASPTQLRPNPATTGILNAIETKDTFLAGGLVWNRINSGEMSIIALSALPAEMGTSQGQGGLSARMSISII